MRGGNEPATAGLPWVRLQASGTLLLRLAMVGLEFLGAVALARVFEAAGYGVYAFVVSLLGLLAIPATLGFDRLLVREIARFKDAGDWPSVRGLLRWSGRLSFSVAVSMALAGFAVLGALLERVTPSMRVALAIGLVTIPLTTMARLRTGALQGLGHVQRGLIPESIVQPGVVIVLAGGALLLPAAMHTGAIAVSIHAIAMLAAFVVGAVLLRRELPDSAAATIEGPRRRQWLLTALPLAWVLGMNVVLTHTDVVMLGFMHGTSDAGVYRIAVQLAALASLPLGAVNLVLAPRISAAFFAGRIDTLQSEVTHASRYVLLLTLPVVGVMVLGGSMLLALFGQEFVSAALPLAILAVPQLLNAATGTAGYLLVMTQCEKQAAVMFASAAILNVALNLFLIPRFGMTGAAGASALAMIALNVGLAWGAWRWVKVLAAPIVRRTHRRTAQESEREIAS